MNRLLRRDWCKLLLGWTAALGIPRFAVGGRSEPKRPMLVAAEMAWVPHGLVIGQMTVVGPYGRCEVSRPSMMVKEKPLNDLSVAIGTPFTTTWLPLTIRNFDLNGSHHSAMTSLAGRRDDPVPAAVLRFDKAQWLLEHVWASDLRIHGGRDHYLLDCSLHFDRAICLEVPCG